MRPWAHPQLAKFRYKYMIYYSKSTLVPYYITTITKSFSLKQAYLWGMGNKNKLCTMHNSHLVLVLLFSNIQVNWTLKFCMHEAMKLTTCLHYMHHMLEFAFTREKYLMSSYETGIVQLDIETYGQCHSRYYGNTKLSNRHPHPHANVDACGCFL